MVPRFAHKLSIVEVTLAGRQCWSRYTFHLSACLKKINTRIHASYKTYLLHPLPSLSKIKVHYPIPTIHDASKNNPMPSKMFLLPYILFTLIYTMSIDVLNPLNAELIVGIIRIECVCKLWDVSHVVCRKVNCNCRVGQVSHGQQVAVHRVGEVKHRESDDITLGKPLDA